MKKNTISVKGVLNFISSFRTTKKKHVPIEVNESGLSDVNGIYPSQIESAQLLSNALEVKDKVIFMAPMQYGKTGTIYHLCNILLRNKMEVGENIIVLTGMGDNILFEQNKTNLQDKDFINGGVRHKSNIFVAKMLPDFKNHAEEYIDMYNVKYIVFDECDYGSGTKSLFNKTFFKRLKAGHFSCKLVLVSATPYCAIHALFSGELDCGIVKATVPSNYFGVSEMFKLGLIRDINDYKNNSSFESYTILTEDGISDDISDEFKTDLEWFNGYDDDGGLSIVRVGTAEDAYNTKLFSERFFDEIGGDVDVISIGVNRKLDSICSVLGVSSKLKPMHETLPTEISLLERMVIHKKRKVLLIVVKSLTAGKDLGELKEYVRLIVETRKNMIANGSQGLVGRMCGYHNNRNIRIIASAPVLKAYVKLDNNVNIMVDDNFIEGTIENQLSFTTQLRKASKSKTKWEYGQKTYREFTYDDIRNKVDDLMKLFPTDDATYGEFSELENICLNGKQTRRNSAINSQRRSKYSLSNIKTFNVIWNECLNEDIVFSNRFHRFRSEGNENKRLRIKRGLVIDDTAEKFYIIDRIDNGTEIDGSVSFTNKSCYIK